MENLSSHKARQVFRTQNGVVHSFAMKFVLESSDNGRRDGNFERIGDVYGYGDREQHGNKQ